METTLTETIAMLSIFPAARHRPSMGSGRSLSTMRTVFWVPSCFAFLARHEASYQNHKCFRERPNASNDGPPFAARFVLSSVLIHGGSRTVRPLGDGNRNTVSRS